MSLRWLFTVPELLGRTSVETMIDTRVLNTAARAFAVHSTGPEKGLRKEAFGRYLAAPESIRCAAGRYTDKMQTLRVVALAVQRGSTDGEGGPRPVDARR